MCRIFFFLFIFGCTVSLLLCRLSLIAASRGYPPVPAQGLLIAAASLVAEHGLLTRGLSSCGARALLLCGMCDLPGAGIEPMSPALAGGFFTTEPPGKLLEKCKLKRSKLSAHTYPNE